MQVQGFIYVADCKVCTQKQLSYITVNGGRVITVMPDTWKESKSFKDSLRTKKIARKVILRRKIPGNISELEYFSLFKSQYITLKNGYAIYWYCSSEKKSWIWPEGRKGCKRQKVGLLLFLLS